MLKQKINQWLYERIRSSLRKKAKVVLKFIDVEGRDIAYLESTNTSDKTLILIHGLNDEKDTWLMLASALKDKYHLIFIDLLGCGESYLDKEFEYTLQNQADFLEKTIRKILDKSGIESFAIAGHSMGGLVVLLADRLPIEKLILIDVAGAHVKLTPMLIEAQQIDNLEELPFLNLSTVKQFRQAMQRSMYKPPNMPNFMIEHMIERKAPLVEFERTKFRYFVDENMLHRDNLEEHFRKIKQDTLIVWGREDLSIDVASAYKINELIRNSTLKIYDKCRHYPQVEKPKELAKDIIEFLG